MHANEAPAGAAATPAYVRSRTYHLASPPTPLGPPIARATREGVVPAYVTPPPIGARRRPVLNKNDAAMFACIDVACMHTPSRQVPLPSTVP